MRIVQVTAFWGPEVLVMDRAPEPVAGAGQVVVAVDALVPVPDGLGVREATAPLQIGPAALSLAGASRGSTLGRPNGGG